MNKFQFIYGAAITLALDALLLITSIRGEIIKSGLIIALIVLFAFSVGVKLMLASATKNDVPTNWKDFASYTIGSAITTMIIMVISILAIG